MTKTFITSDWHLGEERMEIIQRPFQTPWEMWLTLRDNINRVVAPEDELIVVGDCAVKKEWLHNIRYLHGTKTLIRGNHDRRFTDKELYPYFDRIVPEGEGLDVDCIDKALESIYIPLWLTHYPSQSRADRFNLVGHIHSSWKVQKNMLNVGVDVHHFKPVSLKRIPFFFNAISNYYDNDVWVADHPANAAHNDRGVNGSYLSVVS